MPPLTPELVLTSIFGVLAFALLVTALIRRAQRVLLVIAAVFGAGAAGAAWVTAFWPMVSLALLSLSLWFATVDVMDVSWRLRAALNFAVVTLAFLALWPTLHGMSGGKIPCPAYIREHVEKKLVAGLDLRGGMRLVYTVDVDEAIKDKRNNFYEDMRVELTRVFGLHKEDNERPAEETYKKLREKVDLAAPRQQANTITLLVKPGTDPTKIDERFLERFRGELGYKRSPDGRSYTFQIKTSVESAIRERAVGQAREIINRRVDELGLKEAAISTRDEDIIVEVPGEDEKSFANIQEIISKTARLEFKLLDDESPFFKDLELKLRGTTLPPGLEFGTEPVPVGLDKDGERIIKNVTYVLLRKQKGETSQKTFEKLRDWAGSLPLPPDREVGFELETRRDEITLKEEEIGYRTYFLKSRADITGDLVRDAAAEPIQSQAALGGWHVRLQFTDTGAKIFERITGDNVKRRFAVILDERVFMAPEIRDRIAGGNAVITLGSSDPDVQLAEARKLELVLRSGALPAPISPSNEQRIGPSLGRDSIDLAVQGAIGGSVLVLLFMLLYYSRAGLIADIAVVMNLFLQLAILASLSASMTLPGIAGLALTIGISVDANVLINERIREEIDLGKSPRAAVEIGYKRAFSAIFDGHITGIIAGIVLLQFGSGPIKGFAATLLVGIVCSLFTGVAMTRVMFDLWVKRLGRQGRLALG